MTRKKRFSFGSIIAFCLVVSLLHLVGCDKPGASPSSEEKPEVSSELPNKTEEQAKNKEDLPSYLRLPFNGAISTIDPGLTIDTSSIELVE